MVEFLDDPWAIFPKAKVGIPMGFPAVAYPPILFNLG